MKSTLIAATPSPPYYAVIFTSVRTDVAEGYQSMADLMVALAGEQEGFLGIESAREEVGITVSYWRDEHAIRKWKQHVDHAVAQKKVVQTGIGLIRQGWPGLNAIMGLSKITTHRDEDAFGTLSGRFQVTQLTERLC